jgi:glucose/arabinose dehydrogenase
MWRFESGSRRAMACAGAVVGVAALLAGCGEAAKLPVSAGMGPSPQLPPPNKTLIPTVNVAEPQPWAAGEVPRSAAGTRVNRFAEGLDHPRWVMVLPNGDVLVAETNAPPKPDDGNGIKGFFMKLTMKKAGAAVPSANRISLLRDADGDGVAETRTVFLKDLMSPFGMALVGNELFIANADALVKVPYTEGATSIQAAPTKVIDLPGGPINHHWTKNVIASPDGSQLYVTVGSNSNVGERGMAAEEGRAAIWQVDRQTGQHRVFATGLRNPNGMAWQTTGGSAPALWTVVNERDEIGSDLVPDYLTSVQQGGFYGWPYSYYGHHVDERVSPPQPALVAKALVPDYALGQHTASLGLAAAKGNSLPPVFADGMFIGQHGSWNRKPHSGYKVIFVPFANGKPAGPALDVLTDFLTDDGKARGRPVGVALDKKGALLVADDVANVIWRVSAADAKAVAASPNGRPMDAPR